MTPALVLFFFMMPVSFHEILPLPFFRLLKLSFQLCHAFAFPLPLRVIVADLSTLRLLLRLILAQELSFKPHIAVSALAVHIVVNSGSTLLFPLPRLLLHLPLPFFLFPLPLLLLHAPLLLFALSLGFLLPPALFLCACSLLFRLSLNASLLLCLRCQYLRTLLFLFFFAALALLLGQTGHVRSSTCDLSPRAESNALITLTRASHVACSVLAIIRYTYMYRNTNHTDECSTPAQ